MANKNATTIMVVEDNVNVATVLEARLENFGYRVCAIANTGQKAINDTLAHQPDLVLMDILLEGEMNGLEAAEQIASQSDVPIIFLSCLNDLDVLDRAVQTNSYGYILKPYDNNVLRSSIEIALIKYRAAKEREELIAQLESALMEVKRLSGLLPICAKCKKIRDDKGDWHQIEDYISANSEADFSHGVCPKCSRELYPELFKQKG